MCIKFLGKTTVVALHSFDFGQLHIIESMKMAVNVDNPVLINPCSLAVNAHMNTACIDYNIYNTVTSSIQS